MSCWLKSGGVYQREQRKSTCSLKERRIVSPDSFSRQEDRINRISRISRINKSGFRKRRTPQNDPIGFALIHSPSVLFDSRCSLHRSCLRQSISRWSVVVSSPGFGLKKKRVPHKHIYLNFQICFRKGVTARTGLGLNGVDFCRNLFMWF